MPKEAVLLNASPRSVRSTRGTAAAAGYQFNSQTTSASQSGQSLTPCA